MRLTVAHFIKEGNYEFLLRIHCMYPKKHYKQYYFSKSDGWTLIKVRAERNRMVKEFEDLGIRDTGVSKRGGRIPSSELTLDN